MRRRLCTFALSLCLVASTAALAQAAAEPWPPHGRGTPFWLAGHLLAPLGHLYGYLIVEPVTFVFENVPVLFELD